MPQAADFEPPKYLASLIGAINDGGKSLQASAIAFTVVGFYLVATAFSATDEDLLLGHTTPIAQLGIQLPVGFSFAIAPVVFVLVHVYLLIRYDMLAANLRQFRLDLRTMAPVEADRERARQLLANVEFVLAIAVPPGSILHSRVHRFAVWLFVAALPVLVLLLVQISALRDQDELVTLAQRLLLVVDLLALVRYFNRRRLWQSDADRLDGPVPGELRRLLLVVILLVLDQRYIAVPGPEEDSVRPSRDFSLSDAANAPLDFLCGQIHWGCRYLDVSHRPLFGRVWDNRALIELRQGKFRDDAGAALEGAALRGRNLRFADLNASDLFAADLRDADLRRADLSGTRLQGADMSSAKLQDADLQAARLQGAQLFRAQLQGANLSFAQLPGARLVAADLTAATMSYAELQGASLVDARLWGVELVGAQLQGADLRGAQLQVADLVGAQLTGAQITCARPPGALFQGAVVLGGELSPEQSAAVAPLLERRDHCANLSQVQVNRFTSFARANLRGVDFESPLSDVGRAIMLLELWTSIPLDREQQERLADYRFGARRDPATKVSFAAGFRPPPDAALVASPAPKELSDVDPEDLADDEPAYWLQLADWSLTDPAAQSQPSIPQRLASVFAETMTQRRKDHPELAPPIAEAACRYLRAADARTLQLTDSALSRLRSIAGPCRPAN
jgi:uncharacterized protein YjbI with pentapeptide repeats